MKKPVKYLKMLCFLLSFTLLAGCWDYKEITDKIIVFGIAVDYDSASNGVKLTLEIVLPQPTGKEVSFQPKYYEFTSENMVSAINMITTKAGHKLILSHTQVMIFSKEIMKQKELFIGVLDWVKRYSEPRQNIWLVYSDETNAGDIFKKSNPQTEQMVSYYLNHLFQSTKQNEDYIMMPYWKFMDHLQSYSACTYLPSVKIEKSDTGDMPYLLGTELLDKSGPVWMMDNHQTSLLSLIIYKNKNIISTVRLINKASSENVSLRVVNHKTKTKVTYEKNAFALNMQLQLEATIEEIDGQSNIFTPDALKILKDNLTQMLTSEITGLIIQCQRNKTDVLGFGNRVAENYPTEWIKIQKNWPKIFASLPINLSIELKITGSDKSTLPTKEGQ